METESQVRQSLATAATKVLNDDTAITTIDSAQPSWQQLLRAQHQLLGMPLFAHLVDDLLHKLAQAPTGGVTLIWQAWLLTRQLETPAIWLQAWLACYPRAGDISLWSRPSHA